jgi:hypothetical protein
VKRGGPLKRTGRVNPVSARRRSEQAARDACVEEVHRRDGTCQLAVIFPEVTCGWLPDRRQLEVDEVHGGAMRCTEHTDPAACRLVCPKHHDHKTLHKRDALARGYGS